MTSNVDPLAQLLVQSLSGFGKWVVGAMLAALAVIAVVAFFITARKATKAGHKHFMEDQFKLVGRSHVLLVVLLLELAVVLAGGLGYLRVSAAEVYDYYAFAFPCAAGIVVGLGLLRPSKDHASPITDINVVWFLASAGFIFVALVFYGLRHGLLYPSVAATTAVATGLLITHLSGFQSRTHSFFSPWLLFWSTIVILLVSVIALGIWALVRP